MPNEVSRNPVAWFEIPVVDMERAKAFYAAVFGSEFTDMAFGGGAMSMFPMAPHLPGAGGSLIKHEQYEPSPNGTLIYFSVEDLVATTAKVAPAGGEVCVDNMSIGEFGAISIFTDCEGNRIGLHQSP